LFVFVASNHLGITNATLASSSPNNDYNSLSGGAIAGIVIAVILSVILIFFLGVVYRKR